MSRTASYYLVCKDSIQYETFINILLKSQVIHIYALLKVGLRTTYKKIEDIEVDAKRKEK